MNSLGRKGEEIAVRFFKGKGYVILEKNYRTPVGEVDIIARDSETIVFIEVKARSGMAFGYPFEAVTARKRQKLQKAALSYLRKVNKEVPARFDVLSIDFSEGTPRIVHIQDAFEG